MVRIDFDEKWFDWAAQIEDETDCDVSAGMDYGQDLGRYLQMVMSDRRSVSRDKIVQVLKEEIGTVLSQEEIEKLAQDFQFRVDKVITNKSKAA